MLLEELTLVVEAIAKINPLIPYYHVVSNEMLPHVRHLYPYKSVYQFLKDIEYLGRKFHPIDLSDLLDFVYKGKKLKKRSLFMTFDDGYSECATTIAPILYRKGIPAAFFVCPNLIDNKSMYFKNKSSLIVDYVCQKDEKNLRMPPFYNKFSLKEYITIVLNTGYKNRHILDDIAKDVGVDWSYYLKTRQPYLTTQQITEMEKMGFYFGGHSLDHANFNELNIEEQIYQARTSIDFIKRGFNINYSIFAFPFSDNNIPLEFFGEMKDYVDISFGNSGTQVDKIKWNLERINFERSMKPASKLYLRKLLKRKSNLIQGKGTIERS